MAGNPFRRSMAMNPPTSDAPTTPQAQQKRTKTKRVKIVSPPDAIHDTATEQHGGRRLSASDSATRAPSPPPPRQSNDDDDDEALSDSTATADSDLDQATANARRNSGSLPPPTAGSGSMTGGMKAPYNPFARTLATSEASFGLQQNSAQQDAQRPRPAMDVDAFKNILLTGSATPPASNTGTSSPAVRRPHDSSSSTDTSSIFDPSYTLHPESPRVDHYDFQSESDDDDEDNDEQNETERSNLMGQGERLDDLAPPAPPKPKSTRGPQTVSFADFDQSIPPNFTAPGGRGTPPLNNTQQKGILRPTIQRSISDLNKPLPPPPEARELPDTAPPPVVPDKDVPQIQQQSVPALPPTPDEDSTPKKVPPPPPASRRQAALPTRPRSASNLSTQESISDIPEPETSSQTPSQLKVEEQSVNRLSQPPPPPPARKVHPVVPSPAPADAPSHPPIEAKPLVPPPPPRRHPSKTGSMRTASPANSLRKDISSPPPSSSGGNNAAAPPPPPPRRAAGGGNSSQRSSIDGRPSSLRKFGGMENQRRASRQSVESGVSDEKGVTSPISSPGTEAAKRDVLADMMDFQKEIDALRAQQQANGGGQ